MRTDGRVVGAVVETGGERRAVRARRGVLLAAGGFEANPDLRRAYGVPGQARDTMGGPGSRGLALQAGIAVGADTDLLDQAWWSPGLTHPDGRSAFALWFTGGIFVNQSADRFVNESMAYDRAGRQILAHLRDGSLRLPYWMIYDDKEGAVPPVKATNVSLVETEKYVAAGLWHTADSLPELAAKIGVPRAAADGNGVAVQRVCRRRRRRGLRPGRRGVRPGLLGGRLPAGAHRHTAVSRRRVRRLRSGHQGRSAHRHRGPRAGHRRPAHPGVYAAGNTMAAPSGTTYPGGGNPIGTSMLFSHLAVLDMRDRRP